MPSDRAYKAVYFPGSPRAVTLSLSLETEGPLARRMEPLTK
jgi:hypothetical protein